MISRSAAPFDPPSFVPKPRLRHGHVMTVAAWARSRRFPDVPEPEPRVLRLSADTEVLARCLWQPDRAARLTVVALHGLEGSSEVHYMRGLAAKAWRLGWNAVLLNQRNCGGTEHLTPGLYHSGLTEDPRQVIRLLAEADRLPAFAVVGYSLGGNLAMKLAGELDDHDGIPLIAAAGVCPTIDLERCVRAIERASNIAYQLNFVRNLRARMRRKAARWPGAFDLSPLRRTWTIRRFDDEYTAPHHGYDGATDYYHRASALRVIDRIRIPALILAAADDPFVPPAQFDDPAVTGNPHVTVRVEPHGGHCGFIGGASPGSDGYWAEDVVMQFFETVMRDRDPSPPAAR
jgi:predicted alpha/beta-fold hydrolase